MCVTVNLKSVPKSNFSTRLNTSPAIDRERFSKSFDIACKGGVMGRQCRMAPLTVTRQKPREDLGHLITEFGTRRGLALGRGRDALLLRTRSTRSLRRDQDRYRRATERRIQGSTRGLQEDPPAAPNCCACNSAAARISRAQASGWRNHRRKGASMKYDLLLTGGEVVDPAAGLRGVMDIGRMGMVLGRRCFAVMDRAAHYAERNPRSRWQCDLQGALLRHAHLSGSHG
jgi:hypothetical protein